MVYEVELDAFQGPLDLLYKLVKKNKIEINKISLAKITEQYLEYTNYFQSFDLDVATEFTLIASELMELKANKLLPAKKTDSKDNEDKRDIIDRLREYNAFKNIARLLEDYLEDAGDIYFRPGGVSQLIKSENELKLNIETDKLKKAFLKAKNQVKDNENDSQIVDKSNFEQELNSLKNFQININQKMEEIMFSVKKITAQQFDRSRVDFYYFIDNREDDLEVVVTLLSILELIKLNKINVFQSSLFSDIKIQPKKSGDKYEYK